MLLVDDDAATLKAWMRVFAARGCTAHTAANLDAARVILQRVVPDLAVVDLCLDGERGLDLITDLHALVPRPIVVIVSGYEDVRVREAYEHGADQVLAKPVPIDKMLQWIARGGPAPETPTLARVAAEHRLEVVAACGSIREAARVLGVSRGSLQRQLDRRMPPVPPRGKKKEVKKERRTMRPRVGTDT